MNAESQIHCDLGEWDWGCWLPIHSCKLNSRLVTLSDGGFEDIPKYHTFHIFRTGDNSRHWERPILLAVYVNVAWILDNKAPLQFH